MKRLIILLVLSFTLIQANPIDGSPTINEIQIIEPDNWFIEIMAPDGSIAYIDSIFIESLFGKAKVEFLDSASTYPFFTQENMSEDLQLSRESDSITVHIYGYSSGDINYSRSFVIGEYPGSRLHNIAANQSLVYDMAQSSYYKTNTPTPGEENTGVCTGKIYGHFLDNNGQPIRNMCFVFYNIMWNRWEVIDSVGTYSATKPSMYYYYNSFRMSTFDGVEEVWDFQPVEFDLEPGDSMEVNFIAMQSSIRPVIQNTIKFNNYPHPASNYTWFFIDNTQVEASAMRVNVYALNGRKVDSFVPSAYQCRYDCSKLAQGSYIMTLQHGREVLATKKLQIMK